MIDEGTLANKERALYAQMAELREVLVAFSGGVDSSLVLKVAKDVLGDRARALIARSPSLPARELDEAFRIAAEIGVPLEVVATKELATEGYVANAPDRCYYCKSELFDVTKARVAAGSAIVVDGVNADDLGDHRPGLLAGRERGVVHPLAEAGFTKDEVRHLSKKLGLSTWKKPQLACLASRVPYGTRVTPERLGRIERVEDALRDLGCFDVRARLVSGNDDLVRIEVGDADFDRVVANRRSITERAKAAGFKRVTLDLESFRSGSMNADLVELRRG
ncbi:MAG: ATP-dependent sacrificial sulfur transferase LarE [Deltaproteobacteria bacterium]|nr:ATP-dependent sacrificial sulfur transferase LarE [Deltaproteobacteria bacterium]